MRGPIGIGLLLAALLSSGCAAFYPVQGIPARKLPDEFRMPRRSGQTTIDLSQLTQTPPADHLVDAGDVLGIYVEGILGRDGDVPPVFVPQNRFAAPSVGYPIAVQGDGTISLPLVGPVSVRGMTIRAVEAAVREVYTQGARPLLQPGQDRILVSLQQARLYSVLVIRQEADNQQGNLGQSQTVNFNIDKRGTGRIVLLPAYKNDILHALAETGGLPGLDAQNAIYIVRGRRHPAAMPMLNAPPAPAPMTNGAVFRGQSPAMWTSPGPMSPPRSHQRAIAAHSPPPSHVSPYQTYRSNSVPQSPLPLPQASFPEHASPRSNVSPYQTYYSNSAPPPNPMPPISTTRTRPQTMTPDPPRTSPQPPIQSNGVVPASWSMPMPAGPPGAWTGAPMGNPPAMPAELSWIASSVENPTVIRIPLRHFPGEPLPLNPGDAILQDGDIIFIEARDTDFFFTGGLLGGGQYTLPRDYDINVLDAISIAELRGREIGGNSVAIGGVSALNQDVTVGASRVVILRKQPDGTRLPIEVDLHRAMRDPSELIIIEPEDRIFLRYTPGQAVLAFFERHLLEGFLIGAATTMSQN